MKKREEEEVKKKQSLLKKHTKQTIYAISSMAKKNISTILRKLREHIEEFRENL